MITLELFITFVTAIYFTYKWATKTYKTFEERGIPHMKPFMFIGNLLLLLRHNGSFHRTLLHLYKQQKHNKIFGYYNFRDPIFIVNDPALIKKMAIKDFDAFTNHQHFSVVANDAMLGSMLLVMRDQRWKNMRNTLVPIFSGAKMKAMFVLMNECFEEAIKYLHQKFLDDNDSVDVDLKDCFFRLSNDIIATTAFGLKVNSYQYENNEFYSYGKSTTSIRGIAELKFLLLGLFGKLFECLNIKMLDDKRRKYFTNLVMEAIRQRETQNIKRPDMIQLLMQAKRESPLHQHQWTETDIVAQCFFFFFAAFENNATLLCTTCYELVENVEIQQKLRLEILKTSEYLNGQPLDYDTLKNMKYLDQVLSECLRKWTLAPYLDRECGKDYKVYDDDGKLICELKKGDKIWFQVMGLHHDEQYFKQPEVFEPERFNEHNKHKIEAFTYLPFGVGPRICPAARYAFMQAKAMIFYLLKDFELRRSDKMCKDLLEDVQGMSLNPKHGFWFVLSKRK